MDSNSYLLVEINHLYLPIAHVEQFDIGDSRLPGAISERSHPFIKHIGSLHYTATPDYGLLIFAVLPVWLACKSVRRTRESSGFSIQFFSHGSEVLVGHIWRSAKRLYRAMLEIDATRAEGFQRPNRSEE